MMGDSPTGPDVGQAARGAGTTGDMQRIENDIALSATLIDNSPTASPVLSDPGRTLPETANVYAYQCYEKSGAETNVSPSPGKMSLLVERTRSEVSAPTLILLLSIRK